MNRNFGVFQALALLSQVGIAIIIPIIAGVWIGNKLDGLLGTDLIFLVIFTITGILTGFRSAYKLLMFQQDKKG